MLSVDKGTIRELIYRFVSENSGQGKFGRCSEDIVYLIANECSIPHSDEEHIGELRSEVRSIMKSWVRETNERPKILLGKKRYDVEKQADITYFTINRDYHLEKEKEEKSREELQGETKTRISPLSFVGFKIIPEHETERNLASAKIYFSPIIFPGCIYEISLKFEGLESPVLHVSSYEVYILPSDYQEVYIDPNQTIYHGVESVLITLDHRYLSEGMLTEVLGNGWKDMVSPKEAKEAKIGDKLAVQLSRGIKPKEIVVLIPKHNHSNI